MFTSIFHSDFSQSSDVAGMERIISSNDQWTMNSYGLRVENKVYTSPISTQCLALYKDVYAVTDGEFRYEACLSANQIMNLEMIPEIYRDRIRNVQEDYRICCSGIVLQDESNQVRLQILLTNSQVYGYYEQIGCFTSVFPLCQRRPDDYLLVGIGISVPDGWVKFYINRQEMFCLPRIGYRLSDQYQVLELDQMSSWTLITRFRVGFGHFSFLDHARPNNYHRVATSLAPYLPLDRYREIEPNFEGQHVAINPDIGFAYTGTDPTYFLFEQGMTTQIKYLSGYLIHTSSSISSDSSMESDSFRKLLHQNKFPSKITPLYQELQDRSKVQGRSKVQDRSKVPPVQSSTSTLSLLYRQSKQ